MFSHLSQFSKIVHFISTRKGGVSAAPFDSLNVSFSVGDFPENVLENRRILAKTVGIAVENCIIPQLCHGTNIEIVRAEDRGRGIFSPENAFKETDALITNIPEICLWVTSADCTPVFFYDPEKQVVAMAHAGWKGTFSEIAAKTALKMQTDFACNLADIRVGIGTSIGVCCYEVSAELAEKFAHVFGEKVINARNEAFYLDLWEANKIQLEKIGILPQNIEIANICTACHTDLYYSFRKETGNTGRFCAGIYLRGL